MFKKIYWRYLCKLKLNYSGTFTLWKAFKNSLDIHTLVRSKVNKYKNNALQSTTYQTYLGNCSGIDLTQIHMNILISPPINSNQALSSLSVSTKACFSTNSEFISNKTKLKKKGNFSRISLFHPKFPSAYLYSNTEKRNLKVLGIESSCDDTGAAVLNENGTILGDALFSQTQTHLM